MTAYQDRAAEIETDPLLISMVAHILTGLVGATCCHSTGGYGRKDGKRCECREVAKEVLIAISHSPQLTASREEGRREGLEGAVIDIKEFAFKTAQISCKDRENMSPDYWEGLQEAAELILALANKEETP